MIECMRDAGEDLKKLQEELDVSVMEIAQAADLHPQTVYKVLGNGGAGRNSIKRVKKALNELRDRSPAKAKTA